MTSVVEWARVRVLADHRSAFEHDLAEAAATVLPRAQGFLGFQALGWCCEDPAEYAFVITWATLADHTEGFRNGPLFGEWRAHIGGHFAEPPVVVHYEA